MILASAMKTISLTQLVSSCMDANRQGCEIIKSFHEAHQTAIIDGSRLKEGGNAKSVVTQADVDAQDIILKGLRETWGKDLLIIGEEDEADDDPLNNKVDDSSTIECCLRKDILFHHEEVQTVIPQDCDEEIPINELAIFVDPLDGTREFVEGRLQNVACLIGIARNNRPIAGVIGIPFPSGNPSSDPIIHYAVADQIGIAGVWPINKESYLEPERDTTGVNAAGVTILTGDSDNPVLKNATFCADSIAKNANHLIIGGTAAKLRFVAKSSTPTIAILHFETELWDTCATEALLNCNGGQITDLFGSPLVHSPNRKFGNIFGVVASSGSDEARNVHTELCQRMRADTESVNIIFQKWMGEMTAPDVPQAIDLARDLDGIPYGLPDLQNLLKSENPKGSKLVGYSVPEADAWRGLMSNGVRFQLHWEDENALSTSDMFYKRIVMADLTHARDKLKTAPHKVCRSYTEGHWHTDGCQLSFSSEADSYNITPFPLLLLLLLLLISSLHYS
jgi:3'-phosphoadenosine 5'-phosphosulfate (PAPS) 3'-phosphatase